jgi:hypothetical protein
MILSIISAQKMPRLVGALHAQSALRSFGEDGFAVSEKLEKSIRENLTNLRYNMQ